MRKDNKKSNVLASKVEPAKKRKYVRKSLNKIQDINKEGEQGQIARYFIPDGDKCQKGANQLQKYPNGQGEE